MASTGKSIEGLSVLVIAPQPFFQDRGTPIANRLLVEELVALGCKVDLLTYHEGDDVALEGVRHFRIWNIPGVNNIPPSISWKKLVSNVFLCLKTIGLVRKNRYQLIHAVEESAFIAQFLKLFTRIPYIYDMDSSLAMQLVEKKKWLTPFQPVFKLLEKRLVRSAVGVAAVCKALEDIAQEHAPDSLVVRLEDISLLDHDCLGEEDLRKLCRTEGPIMLYVGNLEGYQGIDLMLEGFRLARERGAKGNLLVIGGSDEHVEHYTKRAEELGIGQETVFCGRRSVGLLAHYLKQADILISPRILGNNTPMKLYSYLDSGRPVLATNLATHTQVLDAGMACLVEPIPESMADGMVRLLADPEYRKRLGTNGERFARKNHSREAFRNKLHGFYREVTRKIHSQNTAEYSQS